jgi:hypothetical protein
MVLSAARMVEQADPPRERVQEIDQGDHAAETPQQLKRRSYQQDKSPHARRELTTEYRLLRARHNAPPTGWQLVLSPVAPQYSSVRLNRIRVLQTRIRQASG